MSEFKARTAKRPFSVRNLPRIGFLLACAAIALSSCDRLPRDPTSAKPGAAGEAPKARAPRHKPADHRVLVMVGPSFASRSGLLAPAVDEYGVLDAAIPESPGMMTVMTWPDSFIVEKRAKLSLLKDAADNPAITVVATIGAPEGTARELTRIRAARPDIRIVTLFAEDDALPLEAVSDLVLDRVLPEGVLGKEGETAAASLSDAEAGIILLGSLLAAEDKDSSSPPVARISVALDSARTLSKARQLGSDWVVSAFIDPDTGLKSRNHLTVEIPQSSAASPQPSTAAPRPAGSASSPTGGRDAEG